MIENPLISLIDCCVPSPKDRLIILWLLLIGEGLLAVLSINIIIVIGLVLEVLKVIRVTIRGRVTVDRTENIVVVVVWCIGLSHRGAKDIVILRNII